MLSDLELAKSYDSGEENADIVAEFLDPVLGQAGSYFRLAGYFNSGMLAAAARGMATFLAGEGTMKVVASPNLSAADVAALELKESEQERLQLFESVLAQSIRDLSNLEDLILRDHVAAMAWMLKTNRLEIRIAVPAVGQTIDALFHHKVGIVVSKDQSERMSFSGSINETAAAWTRNFEDFKVFREWESSERDFFQSDLKRFEDYWNGNRKSVQVIGLPDALRQEILEYAPKDFETLNLRRTPKKPNSNAPVVLRDYQLKAIECWKKANFQGILAMATGTGKTKTAVGCVKELLTKEKRLFIISSSPYQHIATQWTKELKPFSPVQLAGSNNWRKLLQGAIDDISLGVKDVVAVTVVQDTASSDDFTRMLQNLVKKGIPVLFIGDEAHGLGANSRRRALNDSYVYRLGLSATPARYFDEGGTDFLEDYFGGDVFSFPIKDALAWRDPITGARALCDYRYFPVFVDLSHDEIEKYERLSQEISVATAINNQNSSDASEQRLKQLLRDRAMVLKRAQNKIPALMKLFETLGQIKFSLVYCVDTAQLTDAGAALSRHDVSWHRFTGEESTAGSPSERETILRNFTAGDYDALVAMKCLDEGVDVPAANTAFILASSGNPREFIQRRGRLLRPDTPGKVANIYDFVVRRNFSADQSDGLGYDSFESELKRMTEFASSALNELQIRTLILEQSRG
ncbi:MAG: ATP-dependent helicase DbpA [Actinomycetota bacterium]|jgi:superfamily II DNA or RNA helicase